MLAQPSRAVLPVVVEPIRPNSPKAHADNDRVDQPASGSRPEAILEQVDRQMKQLSAFRDSLATSSAARVTSGKVPFASSVAAEVLPPGMKIPFLEHYDGLTDLEDHFAQYQ